jgi:hypothetical protein
VFPELKRRAAWRGVLSVYGIALSHAPPAWKSHGSEIRLHAVRLCHFQAGGACDREIPCWGKVAVVRGKCRLGKVANIDWHEISHLKFKTQRFDLDRTRKTQNLSFYFFTWEIHNGSITFLHLAFSPVFRILHKNGFEPSAQKPDFSRQRNQSSHKRDQSAPRGSDSFTGVRRRKYKLGQTKQILLPKSRFV